MANNLKLSVVLEAVTASFNQAVKQAGNAFSEYSRSITQDSKTLAAASTAAGDQLTKSLNIRPGSAVKRELSDITNQLAAFRKNTSAPAEEVNRITQAASNRIKELKLELSGVGSSGSAGADGIGKMSNAVLGLVGVSAGLTGVVAGLKAIVDTSIEFQGVNKQLEFATGGAAAAKREFNFVKQTAKELGLDLLGAAQGFASFAAATKGTALEGKATRDVFLGVSQASAALNLSNEKTQGTFEALTQIASKGVVQMEELRGQLGDRLPGVLKIAADSMGVTVAKLQKLTEAGLDSTEFLSAFGPALQKAFAGDAARNAETLQGRINLLKNELKLFFVDIGESGINSGLSQVLKDLLSAVESVKAGLQGLDPQFVQAVKSAFEQLYETVGVTFRTLITAAGEAFSTLETLGKVASGVVGTFTGLGPGGASDDVSFLTRTLQGVSVIVGALADGVKVIGFAFTEAASIVELFFATVVKGVSYLTFGELKKELTGLADSLFLSSKQFSDKAQQQVLTFQSSTIAALEATTQSTSKLAEASANYQIDAAKRAADAQAGVGQAAVQSSQTLVTAAQTSSKELQLLAATATDSGSKIAASSDEAVSLVRSITAAADQAQQRLQIFAGAGGAAIVSVSTAANEVAKAFTDLAKESGVRLPAVAETVAQLGAAMGAVAARSKEAAEGIAKNLPDAISKLNGVQLSEFRSAFIGGLEKAGASAEYVKARILELTAASSKTLGVELAGSLKTVSAEFDKNKKSVVEFAANFEQLKTSGVDASKLIADSLAALLAKAKNPVEVQDLIKLWRELGEAGKVTGAQLSDGLEAAKAKLDALKPGINSVNEAFKTFGLQTREEAQKLLTNYSRAFTTLENSGKATSIQLQTAFGKYAEAAIAANGGVASEFLRAEAAAKGLEIQVDKTGKTAVQAMASAAAATNALAGSFGSAAGAGEKSAGVRSPDGIRSPTGVRSPGQSLGPDAKANPADTFGASGSGGIIIESKLSSIGILKGYGVPDEEAARIADLFFDSKRNPRLPPQYKRGPFETFSTGLRNAAEDYLERKRSDKLTGQAQLGGSVQLSQAIQPPPAPKPVSAPRSASPDTVSKGKIDVNFNLGGRSVTAQIDQSDQTAFLAILAQAKGVS